MEFNRNDIRNIAYEKINDRFSKGKYLGVEVTIDMTTGYINGPHLVGQVKTKNNQPKRFDHWKSTKEANELIEFLQSPVKTGDLKLIVELNNVPNELKGTYVHPVLVSHLAQWASPVFAHKVAIILNDRAISEAIEEKNKLIKQRDDKIDELKVMVGELKQINTEQNKKLDDQSKQMADQSRQIAELLGYAKNTNEMLEVVVETLDDTKLDVEVNQQMTEQLLTDHIRTEVKLDMVCEKLDIATERRVPRDPVNGRNEVLAIMKKPNIGEYKVSRCQYKGIGISLDKSYGLGYTQRVYYKEDPNAVNIWNRVKANLPVNIGRVYKAFYIRAPDQTALIDFIKSVEVEKKEV